MPLLKIQTAVTVPPGKKTVLLTESSRLLAEITGKPEKYVMVTLEAGDFLMAGAAGPAAFLDVRGIGGLNKAVNGKLTKAFCDLLEVNSPQCINRDCPLRVEEHQRMKEPHRDL